ncbi:MAG: cytochrome c oxidase subunit II [Flavobacteriales bacterium]|nr:cytochrome c oxidase subunit II [Flavobacteriales bacterium]
MTKLLIIAVLVLGVLAVVRLSRVYELTATLRGKREEHISDRDNRMNARFMWLFCVLYFAFFLWLLFAYGDKMLPVAASEHGVWTDQLLDVNWAILFVVFFLTNILLFYFAGRYVYDKDRKAFYYSHNNKLELLWTVVPAITLIGIIIYGLTIWNRITAHSPEGTAQVELYAKQFDWTARYPGKDGILGATDYRLINDNNPLGVVTKESIETRLAELATSINATVEKLKQEGEYLPPAKVDELNEKVERERRMLRKVTNLKVMMEQDIAEKGEASPYAHGADDVVIKEFHLPVRKDVELVIRSRDVIHSAYIPHLRAQMNAVPGMATRFHMKPTITTDSMRVVVGDDKFDFVLLCNKICGASHYNMQMPLVVESQTAFDAWYTEAMKKPFQAPAAAATPAPAATPAATDSTATAADTTATDSAAAPAAATAQAQPTH